MLYALLHLAGVKAVNRKYENLGELAVSIEDLKKFRQKKRYGWPEDAKFLAPPEVLQDFKAKLGHGVRNYGATG